MTINNIASRRYQTMNDISNFSASDYVTKKRQQTLYNSKNNVGIQNSNTKRKFATAVSCKNDTFSNDPWFAKFVAMNYNQVVAVQGFKNLEHQKPNNIYLPHTELNNIIHFPIPKNTDTSKWNDQGYPGYILDPNNKIIPNNICKDKSLNKQWSQLAVSMKEYILPLIPLSHRESIIRSNSHLLSLL